MVKEISAAILVNSIFAGCVGLIAMEPANTGIMQSKEEQVLRVVLTNSGPFGHPMEDTLAQASKGCSALIRGMVNERKKYLKNFLDSQFHQVFDEVQFVLHKTDSNLIGAISIPTNSCGGRLFLASFNLKNGEILCKSQCWDSVFRLPHDPSPFFDEDKQLCFHGYGTIDIPGDNVWKTVVLYSLGKEEMGCLMEGSGALSGENALGYYHFSLKYFLEYPNLLKALLTSVTGLHKSLCNSSQVMVSRLYYLNKIILPDNYAEFKKYPVLMSGSYKNSIPEKLWDRIKERYCAQKNENAIKK